ncbi:MAG: BON domain-containing protein [Mycobacterium sp.]
MGRAWLIGLAIAALLVVLVGYGLLQRSGSQDGDESASGGAVPTVGSEAPAPPPGMALAPVSVTRHGDEITLTGNLPDPAAKRVLLDAVVTSVEHVNVMDNLGVAPGVKALDFAGSGPVFEAAAVIPDFSLNVSGDTVTLGGTAATAEEADAVQDAAEDAWPGVNIVNTMEISSLVNPGRHPG